MSASLTLPLIGCPVQIWMQTWRTSMPRRLPPFVERWRDRHGKVRVYFRKGRGARIALPGAIRSEEFTAAYQAAISGALAPSREIRVRNAPGTIGALIVSCMKSANYIGLRETTKKGYASRIETLRTKHGHRTVAGLTRGRIYHGDPSALCRPTGCGDIDIEDAAHPHSARDQYRLAATRPLARHQAAKAATDTLVDGTRDRDLPRAVAARREGTHRVRAIFEYRAASLRRGPNGVVAHRRR